MRGRLFLGEAGAWTIVAASSSLLFATVPGSTMNDVAGIFLVLLSFAVTFTVARLLSRNYRQRRAERAEQEALRGQSRQVRRARERRRKRA